MKKSNSIIWGAILVVAGILFALNALGITNIDVFFDGWWTLFIIVPCGIGLFTSRDRFENLLGLAVGVFLLLCSRDILDFSIIWKLALPVAVILIGLKMVFGNIFADKKVKLPDYNKEEMRNGCAIFSGTDMKPDNEVFDGAELTAVFGGVNCDLRNAVIEKDCVINITAIFGGVTILLPEKVNVKLNTNSLFGGVSCKKKSNDESNTATVFVSGTCMFGGAEIK